MTEPRRLLEGEATGLERELIKALAEERPSPALSERMAAGFVASMGPALAGGGTAALTLTKGALVAAVAVAVAGGVSWLSREEPKSTRPAHASLPAAMQPAKAFPPAPKATAQAFEEPNSPPNDPSSAPTSAPPPRLRAAQTSLESMKPASEPTPEPGSDASAADDVSEEIRALDAAKSALRRGDSARALRELNGYARRFPAGVLAQEASVLRIQALARSGDRDTAGRLARQFVARHPSSPHVEQLKRLIASTGE